MKDLVTRFTSRKFLLALSATIAALAAHQYAAAFGFVGAYLTAEGVVDVKTAKTVNQAIAEAQAVESAWVAATAPPPPPARPLRARRTAAK